MTAFDDMENARKHGVKVVALKPYIDYMGTDIMAISFQGGKVIMKDNIHFVKKWLSDNRIMILNPDELKGIK